MDDILALGWACPTDQERRKSKGSTEGSTKTSHLSLRSKNETYHWHKSVYLVETEYHTFKLLALRLLHGGLKMVKAAR